MNHTTYVAFLRGINVGGNSIIKMADLKRSFESLGFRNIVPVLASGNIVFQTSKEDLGALKQRIEKTLKKEFQLQVITILRTGSQIRDLVKSDPFKRFKPAPQTKLHVTFLAQETERGTKFPKALPIKEFQIVQVSASEVCSAVEISPTVGTTDLMKVLEQGFGKALTTRTWNTIQKIVSLVAN
jgi:uncharacterized protein (DUF1697 family)